MTVQDDMIATLATYMDGLTAPTDGYPVIDLDVNYSSRSPLDVGFYVSAMIQDEADDGPNGTAGYVLADRNKDDGSNTMGFVAVAADDNEESEKPYQAVQNAFAGVDYDVNTVAVNSEVCSSSTWPASYIYVTYTGS